MNETPQTPVNWLWDQLVAVLSEEQIAYLRAGYTAQSQRYNRAARLRQIKRELAHYERMIVNVSPTRRDSFQRKVDSRKAAIARMEAEDEHTT